MTGTCRALCSRRLLVICVPSNPVREQSEDTKGGEESLCWMCSTSLDLTECVRGCAIVLSDELTELRCDMKCGQDMTRGIKYFEY